MNRPGFAEAQLLSLVSLSAGFCDLVVPANSAGDGGAALQCPAPIGTFFRNPVQAPTGCSAQVDDGGLGAAQITERGRYVHRACRILKLLRRFQIR
mgnify:CR=1 FL=1